MDGVCVCVCVCGVDLVGHGLGGAVERGLLVECAAVPGDEAGRDEDRVTAEEDRRLWVERQV